MERAYDYARRITANGPFAVRKTKESVLRGWPPTCARPTRSSRNCPARSSQRGRQRRTQGVRREAGARLEEPLGRARSRGRLGNGTRRRARSDGNPTASVCLLHPRVTRPTTAGQSGRRTPASAKWMASACHQHVTGTRSWTATAPDWPRWRRRGPLWGRGRPGRRNTIEQGAPGPGGERHQSVWVWPRSCSTEWVGQGGPNPTRCVAIALVALDPCPQDLVRNQAPMRPGLPAS